MAAGLVYVKFRAQLSWDPISFDGHFISVGELKRLVCDKKSLGDAVAELVLSDPSGSEYSDDSTQIPKGSRVLLRRVPQNKARVLLGSTPLPAPSALASQQLQPSLATAAATSASTAGDHAGTAGVSSGVAAADEFGADPFAQSAASLQQEQAAARNLVLAAAAAPAPKSDRPGSWGMGGGRGGPAGRGGGGRGRGPAAAYICRRCGESGKHWEKDCPTVGDPAFDYKTVRLPTGIPVTKLEKSAEGSLYLPTGQLGQLASNRAAFAKELALMTGAAAAEEQAAAAAENAQQPEQPMLALPAPAAATPPPEEQQQPQLEQQQPAAATPPAQSEQPAGEPDLFDDDDPDLAAPIPITLGADSLDQQGGSKAAQAVELDPAQALELFEELSDVLPLGTTFKIWQKAFAIPQPLTTEEFERLQEDLQAAAAAAAQEKDSARPSRASVEREQQQSTLSRSWSRDEVGETRRQYRASPTASRDHDRDRDSVPFRQHRVSPRPVDRPSRRSPRSRSRSRSRDRRRLQRSPSHATRRTPERSPSFRRRVPSASPPPQDAARHAPKVSDRHDRSPDDERDGGRRKARSRTAEDGSKAVSDRAAADKGRHEDATNRGRRGDATDRGRHEDAADRGRHEDAADRGRHEVVADRGRHEDAADAAAGRKRHRDVSRERSHEDSGGRDRSHHEAPSGRTRGRSPERADAGRSSLPSAGGAASDISGDKQGDGKKKKKHKKDKKRKDKDKKHRKSKRESRSRSRSGSRSRSRSRLGSRSRSRSRSMDDRKASVYRDALRGSNINDRYIPDDPYGNGAAGSSDDERSRKRKEGRRR